jgi:hypothetical protein
MPNLDALAAIGVCGLTDPVSRGITAGVPQAFSDMKGADNMVKDAIHSAPWRLIAILLAWQEPSP